MFRKELPTKNSSPSDPLFKSTSELSLKLCIYLHSLRPLASIAAGMTVNKNNFPRATGSHLSLSPRLPVLHCTPESSHEWAESRRHIYPNTRCPFLRVGIVSPRTLATLKDHLTLRVYPDFICGSSAGHESPTHARCSIVNTTRRLRPVP